MCKTLYFLLYVNFIFDIFILRHNMDKKVNKGKKKVQKNNKNLNKKVVKKVEKKRMV